MNDLRKAAEIKQPEALRLIKWFDECDGFAQGTQAPHKWVLQANAELHRLYVENEQLHQTIEQAEKQKCPWPDGECTTCEKIQLKPSLWFAIHNDGNVKYTTDSARAKGWKESGSYRVVRDYYTAPPKREWQGLTNEDKQEAFDETQEASGGFWEFADYLEAKLKEKNT